jgi:hypothetical protein
MDDIIKVIKLDLSKIDYIEMTEGWGTYINWEKFWDQAKFILLNEIKEKMEASKFKFPIVLQTSMKVMVTFTRTAGELPETRYRAHKTDSISNIKYIANDEDQIKKVLRLQFEEVLEETRLTGEGSGEVHHDIVSYHVRFWEYRPAAIRRVATVFAMGNGYIELPTWLQKRRAIINIKNTDNQCFIKCVYRAINYDKKNRNNNRDVSDKELNEFKKQLNCEAIGEEYVDIGKFEEDNPSISIDIYYIPLRKKDGVSIIYRSKNIDPKYRINLERCPVPNSGSTCPKVSLKSFVKLFQLYDTTSFTKFIHFGITCSVCSWVSSTDKDSELFLKNFCSKSLDSI